MGDIILTNPLEMKPSALKVTNYSWSITPEGIVANLNYYAQDGSIVEQETFYIQDADFEPLKNAVITAGVVGQKYIDVIEKSIRNKVKSMKGWTGTVP
jgi:hypothetical protein